MDRRQFLSHLGMSVGAFAMAVHNVPKVLAKPQPTWVFHRDPNPIVTRPLAYEQFQKKLQEDWDNANEQRIADLTQQYLEPAAEQLARKVDAEIMGRILLPNEHLIQTNLDGSHTMWMRDSSGLLIKSHVTPCMEGSRITMDLIREVIPTS